MSIEKRDPQKRFWVQTTKSELEGKLGTTFSLANGLLGIRGAHQATIGRSAMGEVPKSSGLSA